MAKKKKDYNEKLLVYKFLLCLVYLIIITILFTCSYRLFKAKDNIISWEKVRNTNDYSYIEISKMSEAFAYYPKSNKQVHFVIEKEDTGLWHTYLIAINKSDYDKFKDVIDYTYERTNKKPDTVKVYGYPVIINNKLKNMAIKNIKNFVPKENEVEITKDNFDNYLTNSYMDTTIKRKGHFSFYLFITFFLMFIMILLFIFTCFYKEGDFKKLHNKLKRKYDINFSKDKKYKLVRK